MSLIERAMDKLAGGEPETPEDDDAKGDGKDIQYAANHAGPRPDTSAPGAPAVDASAPDARGAPEPATDAPVEPEASAADPVPTPVVPAGPVPAETARPVATIPPQPGIASIPPVGPPGRAALATDPGGGKYVHVDPERLAAAGHLVPGQPSTREAEEYQQIKRRLLGNVVPGMLVSERPPNLILITSSVPGEGKTFTSINLAISIAMEVDHTVLAVDTDIMKRDMSRTFGVNGMAGLLDVLADKTLDVSDVLIRTSIPNLAVIPAGNMKPGNTELIASSRMREFTDEVASRYADRIILFDSPPVLATTTAVALAPHVGQVVLVAEAGKTKHETVREALHRLDAAPIVGTILNKSKHQRTASYEYYGYYAPTG